jgi:hypothetical protein
MESKIEYHKSYSQEEIDRIYPVIVQKLDVWANDLISECLSYQDRGQKLGRSLIAANLEEFPGVYVLCDMTYDTQEAKPTDLTVFVGPKEALEKYIKEQCIPYGVIFVPEKIENN